MENAQKRPALSVVIPCYNEEDGIDELMLRLTPICQAQFPDDYEIVLINDGSSDRTWEHIGRYADQSRHVIGIDLSRNHGHQLALSAGLNFCRGDLIFIIDADLQDPPELLRPMVEKLKSGGHDVVYGQRVSRAGETAFKKATSSLFYRLLNRLTDVDIPNDTGDFRLMTRRVLDALIAMPERFRFIRGMVGWVGFSQAAFPYEREARFAGHTHYPLGKMITLAIDAITGFSTAPLRFASHLGLLFGFCGLGALVWVASAYFIFGTVAGWTSLAALILIIGSMQLLMLGVFGEYLGRMYMESKQRPLFTVREIRRHALADAEGAGNGGEALGRAPAVLREFG
jgi:dolichol-phosphate mannosyltransferase